MLIILCYVFYRCHHNPNSKCIHCVPLEVRLLENVVGSFLHMNFNVNNCY